MTTRRNFLKYAFLSGAAGSAGMLPSAISRAFAISPDSGTTYQDAEHIVILMQENRSFDHLYGTLQGVRGFNDPRAMRQPNGNPVFVQSSTEGQTYVPWRLNIHDTRITWMGSIPHSRESQVDAWNNGHHDRWVDVKKSHYKKYEHYPMTMGYYTREDLPFYYALADAFTVCDQNYCGVMTSTCPNRLVFWTGTVRDKQSTDSTVYMRNPEILKSGLTWTTFPERLEQIGVSWKVYQNETDQVGGLDEKERAWLSNFALNILECFEKYNTSANPRFHEWVDERIKACSKHIEKLQTEERLVSEKREEQLAEANALLAVLKRRRDAATKTVEQLTPAERSLFERAFVTNKTDKNYRTLETLTFSDGSNTRHMDAPKGDILYQFRKDVKDGQLPTVSWLAAPEHFSDHPASPWYGAWFVSEVMDILTENPEVWKKTIFIMTYDENDGYFDHCCSFTAPDPKRPETGKSSSSIGPDGLEYTYAKDEEVMGVPPALARSGPIGLGFRVPMIIASPWSRGGWVNSQLFEHSSTLQFLEKFIEGKFGKKITETNISPWRRAISGDLTSCFRSYDGSAPQLPFIERDKHLEIIEDARYRPMPSGFKSLEETEITQIKNNPSQIQQYVKQEPGTRPACALPYELYCDGGLSADGQTISLHLQAGTKVHKHLSSGAPFNVYTHNMPQEGGMRSSTYAVAAGDNMAVNVDSGLSENNIYDVSVHAPNGFYRKFTGRKNGIKLLTECKYMPSGKESVLLCLKNMGQDPLEIHCNVPEHPSLHVLHVPAHGSIKQEISLAHSSMWYDLTLTTPKEPEFSYVFAGHVDNGHHSITDPAMGLIK